MDLRRRLVGYLGALLLGLLLMSVLISLHSLRNDVTSELIASEQLAGVLLKTGQIERNLPPAEATARLQAILKNAPLRHLTVSVGDAPPPEQRASAASWLARLLGVEPASGAGQLIHLGEQTLRIAPNPASEIDERLGDTVRLCITLLLFSGATLLVAWWSADRALAPVRELEAGLRRLARGGADAALPAFALREFKQVADAIDYLAAALAASRAAQKALSRQMIRVQEDERRTLARELHDEMGQTLTAIGVTAAYLERHAEQLDARRITECAQDLRRDVRTSGEQLRAMLKRLRPHGLDAQGLVSALRELLAGWQQRASGIDFRLDMPCQLPPLGEDAGLALYRAVQEALTNVVRHSGASHCLVRIELDGQHLHLHIEDDGCGMPPDGPPRHGGLLGIEERLHMVDGSLELGTGQASGLQLRISLPLSETEAKEKQ
ncbi:MAG: sensor histidine kinase [Rhodocyclaceae bacterium]